MYLESCLKESPLEKGAGSGFVGRVWERQAPRACTMDGRGTMAGPACDTSVMLGGRNVFCLCLCLCLCHRCIVSTFGFASELSLLGVPLPPLLLLLGEGWRPPGGLHPDYNCPDHYVIIYDDCDNPDCNYHDRDGWMDGWYINFFLHGKRARGHILTKEPQRATPGTPRKSVFF